MANKQAFGSPMDPEGVVTDKKRPTDDKQDPRKLNVVGDKDVERERNPEAPGRSENREGSERRSDDIEGRDRDATERRYDHDLEEE